MELKLQNIGNKDRKIYLFIRNDDKSLTVKTDSNFYPFFFEPTDDINSKFKAYDGTPLRKKICSKPQEIYKFKNGNTYYSDIEYIKQYIIEKVDNFVKSPIKWAILDIECKTSKGNFPIPTIDPVSCITVYNSFTKKYISFFLNDYKGSLLARETKLLNYFISYVKKEFFDLILGWNIDFDYNYLYDRIKHRYNKNLAELIGYKNLTRKKGDIYYPIGTSIVDYLGLYRKVETHKGSYALDDIMAEELGKNKQFAIENFNIVDDYLKNHNKEDVEAIVKIEEKRKLIPYFDEIRRTAMILWEDLPTIISYYNNKSKKVSNNSKIVDMLVLKEAKKMNVILPNKKHGNEKVSYKGAKRDLSKVGRFLGKIFQTDLGSAYPSMILDFNLDVNNIVENKEEYKEDYPLININGTYFKQNPNAILPRVTKKLLKQKNYLKKVKNETKKDDKNFDNIKMLYACSKANVNALYGVTALPSFRLYDIRIASTITYLVREVLTYCINKLESKGIEVVYHDTDSIAIRGEKDISEELNNYIQEWALKNYNKNISLTFDCEGYYERIFIKALTHYVGYLNTGNGIEKKIKGIEAKRSNSSKFIKKFQLELLDKILEIDENKNWKYNRLDIVNWINTEVEKFSKYPLTYIGFPCKLARKPEDYTKNKPIFLRALQNTQELLPEFNKGLGERYYFIEIIPDKNLDRKTRLAKNVLAFDKKTQEHIKSVNWKKMIEKSIIMKIKPIFEILKWQWGEITEKTEKLYGNTVQNRLFSL